MVRGSRSGRDHGSSTDAFGARHRQEKRGDGSDFTKRPGSVGVGNVGKTSRSELDLRGDRTFRLGDLLLMEGFCVFEFMVLLSQP
eukprot:CAMPEP_0114547006 /NCGR_PEP_ID=MMETSP0114-20121206/4236_1 /TAXON_ID=31324 /ORGANISM="Goniomonas sp, Strain m" /LENGTH=84 /DNA_ID=CAMNT_0001731537 /DNA_START=577 /DNA_END=827 /DNA_ORIENTATION=-